MAGVKAVRGGGSEGDGGECLRQTNKQPFGISLAPPQQGRRIGDSTVWFKRYSLIKGYWVLWVKKMQNLKAMMPWWWRMGRWMKSRGGDDGDAMIAVLKAMSIGTILAAAAVDGAVGYA